MAIECIRDYLKLNQVIGLETSQALVEGEVVVPEDKTPVARVLNISGEVVISSREVIQDKVMVEGVLRYDILYAPEGGDGTIETMDAEIGFTHYLDVPGAKPKMTAHMNLGIEHMDYEVLSGRKLSVKAVLNLDTEVNQVLELEALKEFRGLKDVEVLKDHVHGSSLAGNGHSQTMVREDIEVSDQAPSIQKVLRKDVKVKVNEKKTADNKVIVHGELAIKILYLCEDLDDPVHMMSANIPFSHFVDMPGAYQGMDCDVEVFVSDFYAEAKEDINNELRILDAEIILGLSAEVFEAQDSDILIDAYSPTVPLHLKKKKIKLVQTVGESQGQTVIKQSLTFPEGVPSAKRVLYVDAKPIVTDERIELGKVVLEGLLSTQVVYQTEEGGALIAGFKEDIPFKQVLEIEGVEDAMDSKCDVQQDHVGFTLIAPDEIELKIVLSAKAIVTKSIEKDILIGAEELEEAAPQEGGIYIYFIQPGDSLWSVAKKYNTTIANLLKFNALSEQEALVAGRKLIIFKRLNPAVI